MTIGISPGLSPTDLLTFLHHEAKAHEPVPRAIYPRATAAPNTILGFVQNHINAYNAYRFMEESVANLKAYREALSAPQLLFWRIENLPFFEQLVSEMARRTLAIDDLRSQPRCTQDPAFSAWVSQQDWSGELLLAEEAHNLCERVPGFANEMKGLFDTIETLAQSVPADQIMQTLTETV